MSYCDFFLLLFLSPFGYRKVSKIILHSTPAQHNNPPKKNGEKKTSEQPVPSYVRLPKLLWMKLNLRHIGGGQIFHALMESFPWYNSWLGLQSCSMILIGMLENSPEIETSRDDKKGCCPIYDQLASSLPQRSQSSFQSKQLRLSYVIGEWSVLELLPDF